MFHKLVSSARLFMKKASWGYSVLVIDSFGEPAAFLGVSAFCVPVGSRTEFEVGRTTKCEEGADSAMNASMDQEPSMSPFHYCIWRDMSRFTSLLSLRSS